MNYQKSYSTMAHNVTANTELHDEYQNLTELQNSTTLQISRTQHLRRETL